MTEHTITNEMLDAYVRAHDATWTECAPTTQGEAVSTHRKAVRAGLSAALALVQPATCPCTCHRPRKCPCGPNAPDHKHGAGGYCTVADRAGQAEGI